MADREKVIKGLECCKGYEYKCNECPYFDQKLEEGCDNEALYADTLELLKEQEAVEPEKACSSSGVTWWNICGNCKTAINPNDKFCHECGRPVLWEGR